MLIIIMTALNISTCLFESKTIYILHAFKDFLINYFLVNTASPLCLVPIS